MANRKLMAWIPAAAATGLVTAATALAEVGPAPDDRPFWQPLTVAIVLVLCVFGISIVSSRRDPNG